MARKSVLVAISLIGCAGFSSITYSQPVERHSAKILRGNQITSLPGATVNVAALDETPFGNDLAGVMIVSDKSALHGSVNNQGIVVESDDQNLSDPELVRLLNPFIGQPLSQRLIGEVRDAIVQYMRNRNRPLVAVIIPPQEVTSGTIQLLVVPFRIGDKRMRRVETGYANTSEDKVLDAVRLGPGDEVEADTLLADVNWLNLNPFRRVGVVFQPGIDIGTTDLILNLSDQKPWQIYGGYANSGTSLTGLHRAYLGFVAASAAMGDQQISYQFTASPETIGSGGFENDSAYLAHSLGYFVPLEWSNGMRHKLTLRGDYSRSRSDLVDPFVSESENWQVSLDYAGAIGKFGGAGASAIDWFAGVDFKRQNSVVFFNGTPVTPRRIEIIQFALGLRGRSSGRFLDYQYDAEFSFKGVFSPGDLTPYNKDAVFAAASSNANAKADYRYLIGDVKFHMDLPNKFGFDLALSGQAAPDALPSTEQFGIGGVGSVRGYETNERNGDSGAFAQVEFHLPSFQMLQNDDVNGQADIFAFADFGVVHDHAAKVDHSLFGAGLGANFTINDNIRGAVVWGHAFEAGSNTAAGSDRIHATLTMSF